MAAMIASAAVAANQEVYINDAGGAIAAVRKEVFYTAFTEQTGIRVVPSSPTDNAKLKVMVESGNTQWDIVNNDGGQFLRNVREGLLQKLDHSRLPISKMEKRAVHDYGVWNTPYATILVWNTTAWPKSTKQPTSAMDLWNQTDFPGPRCLQKSAVDNVEWGLLHAGVAPDRRYPIDEDRAYKELDKLKRHVSVWWESGAQSMQAVLNGDCVMGTAWNGRIYNLIQQEKAPLRAAWKDGILHESWWVIPRGAKNIDAAYRLLAFMHDPVRQAKQADLIKYAGGVPEAANYMTEATREALATAPKNLAGLHIADDGGWWADNGPAAEKRFLQWLIK